MAAANKIRGEHSLKLGGRTFVLRPSHAAIVAIEDETDLGLLEIISAAARGGLRQRHMGIIAAELIRAGAKSESDKHVDAERIGEMIYEAGTGKALATLQLCLVDAATGGRTASGEAKAAAAATEEDAGAA